MKHQAGDEAPKAVCDAFNIANEFTEVIVRKVSGRYGDRLEIGIAGSDRRIRLDALQLESLACQEPALFTQLMARELGSQS
ncbi:hypothetical protein L3V59_37150 [Burkholderia aenigmatica]|uniref:hypothetical protein n=1 Tax=Burkholderia cepacia complex TaxID=87882 RepID=UPI001C21F943|nr:MULTISPECIES: hypothetical protein [Burkholderia cepacia complex]HDR8923037.1 hypothetical protein [Burkholderia vietnamiensis]MBU9445225.1 hypothetical protein [Burkholderia multivorans]MCA8222103.1 hypothetical protein [Burkholderia multivorans]UKD17555.1 hypothetical protein L3V59_37150 [Burkholderia aenigmatica]HDR8980659.1 hypothetical protein [Burkholderia vietnamiensis]